MQKLFLIPLFAAIILSGCTTTTTTTTVTTSSSSMLPTTSSSSASSATSTSMASQVSVNIQNFAFSPNTLTVKAGTTVTWTNMDSVSHTVTSDSGSELNSGNIPTGSSYSHTFNTPGTYNYHCSIHTGMVATIVVTS